MGENFPGDTLRKKKGFFTMIIRKDGNGFTDLVYKTSETKKHNYVSVTFKIPQWAEKTLDVTPESIGRIIEPLLELGAEIKLEPRYIEDVWAVPDITKAKKEEKDEQ